MCSVYHTHSGVSCYCIHNNVLECVHCINQSEQLSENRAAIENESTSSEIKFERSTAM